MSLHSADHKLSLDLPDEADTLALGARIAPHLTAGILIGLSGPLGAGKTTLVRGILQGLGYAGRVKSPTFTLVEVYEISRLYLYHFDFYRFNSPRELGEAGLREYFTPDAVNLVEWPEKAQVGLPAPDLTLSMQMAGTGRRVDIYAASEVGKECLRRMNR